MSCEPFHHLIHYTCMYIHTGVWGALSIHALTDLVKAQSIETFFTLYKVLLVLREELCKFMLHGLASFPGCIQLAVLVSLHVGRAWEHCDNDLLPYSLILRIQQSTLHLAKNSEL